MRTSTKVAVTITVGLALTLTACNTDSGDEPTPAGGATTTSASETPADEATDGATSGATDGATGGDGTAGQADETDEPDVAFGTEPQSSADWPGSGGDLLPVGVRVGAHEGYERVVFDLEGSDSPGWRVEYVDAAISEGKGDEIDVDGDATLQVILTGFRIPEGQAETDKLAMGSFDAGSAEEVEEVYVSGIFEGQNQAFIGVDEQVPFRVFALTDPARVVVDVQTAG
ncbi:hypothetical protein ACFSBG_03160 [Georgenia yuyongxinii]|uniref:AMIN-like domain-containing (lipo)protein n=1 Tax=Georgenia yuyongxinii TaxID=2589797 RepID=UPI00143DF564|nr:hypothetical protein [Georgenia yuyongxinii]